jgi:hypothetical protein
MLQLAARTGQEGGRGLGAHLKLNCDVLVFQRLRPQQNYSLSLGVSSHSSPLMSPYSGSPAEEPSPPATVSSTFRVLKAKESFLNEILGQFWRAAIAQPW